MKFMIRMLDKLFLDLLRTKSLVNELYPSLKNVKTILDVGSSDGLIPSELSKKLRKTKFTGIDVKVPEKTFIKVKKYNGEKIPFPDNSFDCVMLIDVLHHTKNMSVLLKETKRVSKKKVIIKEHYWTNKLNYQILKFTDYITNASYNIPLTYNYLKLNELENLFRDFGFKIKKVKIFKYSFFGINSHVFYELEI